MCSSDAPDYTPMANASAESARIMGELGREQMAEARRQYDAAMPTVNRVVDAQLATMDQTQQQGQDYYDYMRNTFRPVEQSFVDDVNNYNTDAERERLASAAAADVGRAGTQSNEANARRMAAMGINPNSGRFASMQAQGGLQLAGARANAMNNARNQAEATGYARKLDAIGVGRNLPGASASAYGQATGAGTQAANNVQTPGSNLLAGNAQGGQMVGSGQSTQLQGLQSILNSQTNLASQPNPLASLFGTGLGIYAGKKW